MSPNKWMQLQGTVQQGHQVASGLAQNSPYNGGSIALQTPFFQELGLDLSPYFRGTINLLIAPYQFEIIQPFWQTHNLRWTDQHPPETFSVCQLKIHFRGEVNNGLVYYPHPETKQTHFQAANVLELLSPELPGLQYGDRLTIELHTSEIKLTQES